MKIKTYKCFVLSQETNEFKNLYTRDELLNQNSMNDHTVNCIYKRIKWI